MRKYLRGHTHGDAFGSLRKKQRETYRKLRRFLIPTVIRGHPVRYLRIEYDFLREFAEPRLDVTRGGVAVTGEDVSPVTLAVYQIALLAQLNEGAQDGRVSVRMIFHRLSDQVRDLGKASVILFIHRMKHAPLHGLQTVHDMRNGSRQNYIGGIVQEPVLEHSGKFELSAVVSQQLVESSRRLRIFRYRFFPLFLFYVLLKILVVLIFIHKLILCYWFINRSAPSEMGLSGKFYSS